MGSLGITDAAGLVSLRGLGQAALDGLDISKTGLVDLDGPAGATAATFSLSSNERLTSLTGFPAVPPDGHIDISECRQLTNVDALTRVTSLARLSIAGTGAKELDAPGQGDLAFGSTRSIECNAVDIECSTCGRDASRCEAVLGALPEAPAPPAVAGCACEADANGDARVSLACFCSVHDCPSYADFAARCPRDLHSESEPTVGATWDDCGKVWFSTGEYRQLRFAYSVATRELLGAALSSAGPVSEPCASYRVSAGEVTDCATTRACSCEPPELSLDSCARADGPGAP